MSDKIGMQNKSIKRNISNKINDWVETIEDDNVKNAIFKDAVVSGGAIASMLMGDKVNDYDVYFRTQETTKLVAEYYIKKFKEQNQNSPDIEVRIETHENIRGKTEERVMMFIKGVGVGRSDDFPISEEDFDINKLDTDVKYRPVYISENAITLTHQLQIVTRFYGTPSEIHENYDFIHTKCYFDYGVQSLVTPLESVRATQSKTLVYEGSLYPLATLFRIRKFINRGWRINAGEILKIALQISNIDLLDSKTLRSQLVGVDVVYFNMLLTRLEALDKGEDGRLQMDYVVNLINEIFGD